MRVNLHEATGEKSHTVVLSGIANSRARQALGDLLLHPDLESQTIHKECESILHVRAWCALLELAPQLSLSKSSLPSRAQQAHYFI